MHSGLLARLEADEPDLAQAVVIDDGHVAAVGLADLLAVPLDGGKRFTAADDDFDPVEGFVRGVSEFERETRKPADDRDVVVADDLGLFLRVARPHRDVGRSIVSVAPEIAHPNGYGIIPAVFSTTSSSVTPTDRYASARRRSSRSTSSRVAGTGIRGSTYGLGVKLHRTTSAGSTRLPERRVLRDVLGLVAGVHRRELAESIDRIDVTRLETRFLERFSIDIVFV